MPSSLWFKLRGRGCFGHQSSYQRSYDNDRKNYIESKNGCHDIKGNTLSSDNSKNDKEEKDN